MTMRQHNTTKTKAHSDFQFALVLGTDEKLFGFEVAVEHAVQMCALNAGHQLMKGLASLRFVALESQNNKHNTNQTHNQQQKANTGMQNNSKKIARETYKRLFKRSGAVKNF